MAIPVSVFNYSASVIPVIFSILLSYIHRWVDSIMPDVLKTVATPTLTLFIGALAALVVIGPIGIWLGKGVGEGHQRQSRRYGEDPARCVTFNGDASCDDADCVAKL